MSSERDTYGLGSGVAGAVLGQANVAQGIAKEASPKFYVDTGKQQITSQDELGRAKSIIQADAEHRSLKADQALMLHMIAPHFAATTRQLTQGLFHWFRHQGFWPANWNEKRARWVGPESTETITIPVIEYIRLKKMEKLGLIVTEVAETMEAVRKGDVANELEEMADVEVRHKDYIGGFGFESEYPNAFESKMIKNYDRPLKHGKAF